jgi:polysaccharide deacetylase family protein (PEP-CTERM system associated)
MSRVLNAITIDVEEYFHALNLRPAFPSTRWDELPSRVQIGVERFLALLAERSLKATFFVLGWVAERHPELVRRIAGLGHELASHGYGHQPVWELDPDAFRTDLRRGLRSLEDSAGARVRTYRASNFSITPRTSWAIDILLEEGIEVDSSIMPVRHDRYGYPSCPPQPVRIERAGGSLLELPPLTRPFLGTRVAAGGGGYLRLLPMWFHTQAVARMNAAGHPAVLYLHPWELDPEQPRGDVGLLKGLRHYSRLAHTGARLAQLLDGFAFGTLGEVARAARENPATPAWKP